MPAKEFDGGVKPAVKSTISNLSSSRNWFTDLLLTPAVAIFLLVLLFVVGFAGVNYFQNKVISNEAGRAKVNLGDTSKLFQSQLDSQRFDNFISSNELAKAFSYLSDEYSRSPSDDKRAVLLKLADYIKAKLPEAKAADLTVPCRQVSCGAVASYTDDMSDLKGMIGKESALTDQQKSSILFSLENAALARGNNNKVREFNSLFGVFQTLRYYWQANKSMNVKKLADETLSVIKQTTPDYYESAINNGLFEIK